MTDKKLVAFISGIITAYVFTSGMMSLVAAFWIWVMQWLMVDQGLSFWRTALCMGMFTGLLSLLKSIPALLKAADGLYENE